MFSWRIALAVFITAVLTEAHVVRAQVASIESAAEAVTMTDAQRIAWIDRCKDQDRRFDSALMDAFEHAPNDQVRIDLAYVIGQRRVFSRPDLLIPYLSLYDIRWETNHFQNRWTSYPVAEALGKIGEPAVFPIMRLLVTTVDDKTTELGVGALRLGVGREGARGILRSALQIDTDKVRQQRLQKALKELIRQVGDEPKPGSEIPYAPSR